jgi:hypothetical protein
MFRASIAPQAGNLDAIHGGLVNLLVYSYHIYCQGEAATLEPLDVMNYIYKEMYECIVNKKTPVYAPYVMKLIIAQQTNHPLVRTNLVDKDGIGPARI